MRWACLFWWRRAPLWWADAPDFGGARLPESPTVSSEAFGLDLRCVLLDRNAGRAAAQGAAMPRRPEIPARLVRNKEIIGHGVWLGQGATSMMGRGSARLTV